MRFAENIQLLEGRDPELADELRQVDFSSLSLVETRLMEKNLCDTSGPVKRYFHSNYSPSVEMERWRESLSLDGLSVVYLFGVGVGYAYDHLKGWLDENSERYLVILEDDLRVLYRLLETERGSEMLRNEQVMICRSYTDSETMELLSQDLALYFVGLPFDLFALPFYERHRAADFTELHRSLMHASAYVHFAGSELMNYGVAFYRNFYSNMLRMEEATGCRTLYGAFANVPAIICGAGPSLNKNVSVLKELDERALIFAGGSAINALTGHNVQPHFGGSIDPNKTQAERMSSHTGFELPIFFKGRTHFKALEALHGPKIYLSGNNMYPLSLWLEEKLGIEEPQATEGYNVLHLLIDLATRFGCNPIIFVGMDLAFTDMQSYAGSVVKDAGVTAEEITAGSDLNTNAFERKDINGQPVHTLWKWVAEAQYTSHYAANRPNIEFINATEGGIGFEGIPNKTLREVVKSRLSRQYDLRSWVHQELEASRFDGVTQERVITQYRTIYDSLETCHGYCIELVEQFDLLMEQVKERRKGKIAATSEEISRLQKLLSNEIACQYILEPVNQVRSVIYERQFSQIGYDKELRSDLERMLKRCEHNAQEILSLKECVELNQALLRKILEEQVNVKLEVGS